MRTMTHAEWVAEGRRRFGDYKTLWRFECVKCKHPATWRDFCRIMAEPHIDRYLAFSCIGRYAAGVGCDWTLGGLFSIHTLEVVFPDGKTRPVFEFAPGAP